MLVVVVVVLEEVDVVVTKSAYVDLGTLESSTKNSKKTHKRKNLILVTINHSRWLINIISLPRVFSRTFCV